jgi:N,N'-diacetylchitobiose transport system permease protein
MSVAPRAATSAADLGLSDRRRSRGLRAGIRDNVTPYLLLLPTIAVLVGVLAWPLYWLGRISFEHFGLEELIAHKGTWTGLDNYREILGNREFWHIVLRTVVFTVVNVGLTMLFSTLIALLLVRMGRFMRVALLVGLVWVWATPVVVAITIWQWMVDFQFGVFNWAITKLHIANLVHYNWFDNSLTGFAVITAVVVWGAIPFAAITIYAGLSQVPQELVEAAEVDGARPWQVFRRVTFPLVKPIFVIITSLSIIWDFQVFNQVWIMLENRPSPDYYLLSVFAFVSSFRVSQYGLGAAISVVMVLLMLSVSFVYVRQMIQISEVDQ